MRDCINKVKSYGSPLYISPRSISRINSRNNSKSKKLSKSTVASMHIKRRETMPPPQIYTSQNPAYDSDEEEICLTISKSSESAQIDYTSIQETESNNQESDSSYRIPQPIQNKRNKKAVSKHKEVISPIEEDISDS